MTIILKHTDNNSTEQLDKLFTTIDLKKVLSNFKRDTNLGSISKMNKQQLIKVLHNLRFKLHNIKDGDNLVYTFDLLHYVPDDKIKLNKPQKVVKPKEIKPKQPKEIKPKPSKVVKPKLSITQQNISEYDKTMKFLDSNIEKLKNIPFGSIKRVNNPTKNYYDYFVNQIMVNGTGTGNQENYVKRAEYSIKYNKLILDDAKKILNKPSKKIDTPKTEEIKPKQPKEIKQEPPPMKKEEPKPLNIRNLYKDIRKRAREIKQEPPPMKKEEPKPQPKKSTMDIERLNNIWNDFKGFSSRRNIESFKKKYGNDGLVRTIIDAESFMDFFPTPRICYEPMENILKNADNSLEATAGMGFFTIKALESNPDMKITLNEMNKGLYSFLQKSYTDKNITLTNKNFLEYPNKNSFDLIFLNPPFTLGGDKRFYFNFLFKGLKMMYESSGGYGRSIIFICPPIKEKMRIGDLLLDEHIIQKVSGKKLKDLLEILIPNNKFSEKEIEVLQKIDGDIYEELSLYLPDQIIKIGECDDFASTKIKTDIYHMIFL